MKTYEMIREQQYDKNKTKKSSRAFCCHVVLLLFAPFRIIAEDFISFRALATLFYLIIHTMCECRIAAIILYLRQESVMLIFSLLAEMGIAKIYYFSSNHWSVVFFLMDLLTVDLQKHSCVRYIGFQLYQCTRRTHIHCK